MFNFYEVTTNIIYFYLEALRYFSQQRVLGEELMSSELIRKKCDILLREIRHTLESVLQKDERIYAMLVIDDSGHYVTHVIRKGVLQSSLISSLGNGLEYIASAISGIAGLSRETGYELGIGSLYSILIEFEKVNLIIISKPPYSLAILSDKSLLPGTLRILALKTLQKIAELLFELQNIMKEDLKTTLRSLYTELKSEDLFEESE